MATDFSSLDKLMEFGLGLGIATQMMNTMNTVISRTAMPGVGINPGINIKSDTLIPFENRVEDYYIVSNEHIAGPLTELELIDLIKKKIVSGKTFCWYPGINKWKLCEEIPEINKLILLNS